MHKCVRVELGNLHVVVKSYTELLLQPIAHWSSELEAILNETMTHQLLSQWKLQLSRTFLTSIEKKLLVPTGDPYQKCKALVMLAIIRRVRTFSSLPLMCLQNESQQQKQGSEQATKYIDENGKDPTNQ